MGASNEDSDHAHQHEENHDHHHGLQFDKARFYAPPVYSINKSLSDGFWYNLLERPVNWFRENVVLKLRRPPYPYYHRRFSRVPDIDECYTDDIVCFYEADIQYRRDRLVDSDIVRILRERKNECLRWYGMQKEDLDKHCQGMMDDYEQASINYYIKYGDLGANSSVKDAFMKQKHRLIFERRHGAVGTKKTEAVQKTEAELAKERSMVAILRKSFGNRDLPKDF